MIVCLGGDDDVGLDVHHMFGSENQEVKEIIHIHPSDLNK